VRPPLVVWFYGPEPRSQVPGRGRGGGGRGEGGGGGGRGVLARGSRPRGAECGLAMLLGARNWPLAVPTALFQRQRPPFLIRSACWRSSLIPHT
jgi:hypothetical protein